LTKSSYNNVQPYLDILHEFVLIDDPYKMLRAKWVLGKQTIQLTNITKSVTAAVAFNL